MCMDNFLNYLIKKSDIQNNEFFNYKQRERRVDATPISISYSNEPNAQSYVVLDFETTGFNYNSDRIIEIGAVKVLNGKPCDKIDTLVDPEINIPYYIVEKIGISNEMTYNKPTIEELLPRLVEFIGALPVVAHNARFDMSFLIANCKRLLIDFDNQCIDTLKLSKIYNKECKRHNLQYLKEFFGIDYGVAHRAYDDAYSTFMLYEIIKNKYNNM